MKPVLKWAGGKTQLLPDIKNKYPDNYNTYFEPFIGGGAVLFDLQPKTAMISDVNKELINLYSIIKTDPSGLINALKEFQNDEDYFYNIRNIDRDKTKFNALSKVERASRIVYLNKTCFNGLYRVNKKQEFNVPFGRYKNPKICDMDNILELSKYFNNNNIFFAVSGFEDALKGVKKNDFVYLDPPYDSDNPTAFKTYAASGFTRIEQSKLKECCDNIDKVGGKFLYSNADTKFIRDLFKGYEIKTVQAKRNINSKGTGRGNVNELLISNY